jgi:hypothetical protein
MEGDVAKLMITFGGLCFFVQRTKPPTGLYVFMPVTGAGHGEPHCPMLITEDSSGQWVVSPYDGYDETLGTFGTPKPLKRLPDEMLRMSKYGGLPVEPTLFRAPPGGAVAAKIRMPLNATPVVYGTPKRMIPPVGMPGKFAGQVTVELDVGSTLEIGGRTIQSVSGAYAVQLVNVPRSHLIKPRRHVVIDGRAHHLSAYYGLLKGNWPIVTGDPVLYGENYVETTPDPDPEDCANKTIKTIPKPPMPKQVMRGGMKGFWIEPLNCTIGLGCDEGHPDYPNC